MGEVNDVLLIFLWKEDGNIVCETSLQSYNMASLLLSKNEDELKILIKHDNILRSNVDISKMEKLKVYNVGTVQELYLNA